LSSDANQSQIIGIIIGALLTAFGVLLQYLITERRDKKRRRTIAYANLRGIVERIQARFQPQHARLTDEEYAGLQETVANNYDVLDDSTIGGWNARTILRMVYGEAAGPWEIDLQQFCQDIAQHNRR
jgi:hypothetical protein